MDAWLQWLLNWAELHPLWALALIFVVSLLDCLFIVGLFIFFAAIFLFGIGALIALGALDFWPTVLVAAAGGLTGDAISYALGRRHGLRLFGLPFFSKRPQLIVRGRAFFQKHGGKGLIAAHNIGVLRPLLPAMAGAYGLPPMRFAAAIVPATLCWALLYIVPGVVFGASIGLAAEVAKRLVMVIVGLGLLLWLTLWLSSVLTRWLQRRAGVWLGALLDLSRRNRLLGRLGAALADPQQPETPALAVVATLLLLCSATVLLLVWGLAPDHPPPGADLALYQALQTVREPWTTAVAAWTASVGEWQVYLPYAGVMLITLVLHQQKQAAAHWVAALAFGAVITLGLGLLPGISNPLEYRGAVEQAYFPRDLMMAVIIYGLTPVMLGGAGAYVAVTVLLMLLALARMYLGTLWLSVGLIAIVTGVLWVAALGLGYRRHGAAPLPLRWLAPAGLVWLAALLGHSQLHLQPRLDEQALEDAAQPVPAEQWWTSGWNRLPGRRQDMAGRDRQYLNLQWAGELDAISASLQQRGWQTPAELSYATTLRWLAPDTDIAELPLLPRYHAGHHEALTLRKNLDAQNQYLLRLWPSSFLLDGRMPLWIGTLVTQQVRPVARLFRYPIDENIYTSALDALELPLPGLETRQVQRAGTSYTTLLLRPAAND